MKFRAGPDGIHLFDRVSGTNVLLDEIKPNPDTWASAPRQISIALTNACDLHCAYCYAPKHRARLSGEHVAGWLAELDQGGCFGVGFGGGEPTLHPEFAAICAHAKSNTELAVTFTTHGHNLSTRLLRRLAGNVHFVRVSIDGIGTVYETARGRSFKNLLCVLRELRAISPIGINVVVNDATFGQLDDLMSLAHSIGASELLLLPQQPANGVAVPSQSTKIGLEQWIANYTGDIRLTVSEAGAEGLPACNPLPLETGLRSYAHVDASGILRSSSYSPVGIKVQETGILLAIEKLRESAGGMA